MESEKGDESSRRGRRPGCFLVFLVLGLSALGGAADLLNQWAVLSGIAKSGAIVLCVLGTLLLIPVLLLIGLRIFLKRAVSKVATELKNASEELRKAGATIVADNKAMYGTIHEYREVPPREVEAIESYRVATQQLQAAGFRHLGDVVDTTIERVKDLTTIIRVFVSADATTTLGCCQFTFPNAGPEALRGRTLFICDVSTEFSDGTFLITSNTEGIDLMTPPPMIHRQHLQPFTPLDEQLLAHESEKNRLLAARDGLHCIPASTLAEVMEAERRQQVIKNAFRSQIGFVDPAEVRRIAKNMSGNDDEFADLAADAVDEARREAP